MLLLSEPNTYESSQIPPYFSIIFWFTFWQLQSDKRLEKRDYHSWFRAGSTYTVNGIIDFLKEVKSSLPETIKKVFFRADSGYFSGELFNLLESYGLDYLVKVKLKNLEKLLQSKTWEPIKGM